MAKKNKKNQISTKDLVEVAYFRGPVVVLKDGSFRVPIRCRSINFSLKSSDEQQAIITNFQGFLNLLDFPIQLSVLSKRMDVTPYLEQIQAAQETITSNATKMYAQEYYNFIAGMIAKQNIVHKEFYAIVPYFKTEIAFVQTTPLERLKNIFKRSVTAQELSEEEVKKYIDQLGQRVAMVRAGLDRLGLSTSLLEPKELLALYNSFYNPQNSHAPEQQ